MKNIIYFLAIACVMEIISMENQMSQIEYLPYCWIDHQFHRLRFDGFQSEVDGEKLIQFIKNKYDDLDRALLFPRKKIDLSPVVVNGCTDIATILNIKNVNKALHIYVSSRYRNLINDCIKKPHYSDSIIDYGFLCAYQYQHAIPADQKLLVAAGSDILAATIGSYDDYLNKNVDQDNAVAYIRIKLFSELFGVVMTEPNTSDSIMLIFRKGFNRNTTCSQYILGLTNHSYEEEQKMLFDKKLGCSGLCDYANILYVKMMKKILFFKNTAHLTLYSDFPMIAPYDLDILEQENIIAGPQETFCRAEEPVETVYKVTLTDLDKLLDQTLALIDRN